MIKKISFFVVAIVVTLLFSSCSASKNSDALKIHILDIGKADCTVIQNKDSTVMIDCGEKENAAEIISFLKNNKINEIDYLILSHFDKDHIGSADDILKSVKVKNVIESNFSSDREEYIQYHKTIKDQSISLLQLNYDYEINLNDQLKLNLTSPKKDRYERKEDNNASLIVSLHSKEKNFLFCGDAMEERIEEFLAENKNSFDLVKLPYHGKYLENYPSFLENINPKNCVITCSKKNPPDSETLALLGDLKIPFYLTENGTVQIIMTDDNFNILQ